MANFDIPCDVVVGHEVANMPIVPDTTLDGGWVWACCSQADGADDKVVVVEGCEVCCHRGDLANRDGCRAEWAVPMLCSASLLVYIHPV